MSMSIISHLEVGSGGTSSIQFNSINQSFDHLLVRFSIRATQSGYNFDDIAVRFNGDTSANYSGKHLRTRDNTISAANSSTTSLTLYGATANSATTNAFGVGEFYVFSYTSSGDKGISIQGTTETNSATAIQGGIVSGMYSTTSSISSIQIFSQNGWNFAEYSSASLFGITLGSDGSTSVS